MANVQVNVTKNGTTTLATKDKLCVTDIDLLVGVAVDTGEFDITSVDNGDGTQALSIVDKSTATVLALQDEIDGIVQRTIKTFENSRVTFVGNRVLFGAASLETVVVKEATQLADYCFASCTKLRVVYAPKTEYIGSAAMQACPALESLVLGGDTVCRLSTAGAFSGSSILSGTGYVYVPDDLVEAYKAATNWATYANQIKPLSEWEGM